jgi:hypothetical protein
MKHTIKTFILFIVIATQSSCLDFEELRENPNDPNSVPPGLLFTALLPGTSSSFSDAYIYSQYHLKAATWIGDFSYRFGSSGFSYDKLKDINKMVEEAEAANAPVYEIMAKFLRVRYYISMTRDMGDIPFSEAVKAEEGIIQPKYDSQKEVYLQCLNWLDEANSELAAYIENNPGTTIEGDFYFDGDLKAWQKVINSYTIRTLISLSRKVDDADLDVKGRFNTIINNPAAYPLLEDLSDNMQVEHWDEDGFRGNYNPDYVSDVDAVILADTYVEMLKNYQDPRLFKVADPTPNAIAANPGNEDAVRQDFDSYAGGDISLTAGANTVLKQEGKVSKPNKERFLNYTGQPSIYIGYAEQELNIAEAAQRGWISADAQTHYENGVRASMKFYGISNGEISDYLNSTGAYLPGEEGLTRILEQQYLAFAENSGWESFFMTRRTGVPTYKFSEVNKVTQLPVRWTYPTSEDQDNKENYRAALVSQFGSEMDSRDGVMWILK